MFPVRVGLIGLGYWTREVHIPNLLRVDGAEVAAVCSRGEENRPAARRALGAGGRKSPPAREYADYRELLRDAGVDAVVIGTPHGSHESIAIDALAAGKHVFCEKPVALTVEGCERLRRAHERSGGKVFQTGLELRHADVAQTVHGLIRAGRIGAPAMMWCNILRDWGRFSGWRAAPAESGGMYHELACHYLDLFNWFAGALPQTVTATGASLSGDEIPDRLWTMLRYPGDLLANLGICIFAPEKDKVLIEVIGTEGRITAEILGGRVTLQRRGEGHSTPEDHSPRRPADYKYFGFPGSLESLQAFVRAIREGTQPLVDLQAGCDAVVTSVAATEALRSGRPIDLVEIRP